MSGKLMIMALCFIPLLFFSGCSGGKTFEVNEQQNGTSLEVKQGDIIVVKLQGNPTTGYQWAILPNNDGITELQGEPAYKSGGTALGAGGEYAFKIKAVKTGETTISMQYYRSFEQGIPPIQTFSISVKVQ